MILWQEGRQEDLNSCHPTSSSIVLQTSLNNLFWISPHKYSLPRYLNGVCQCPTVPKLRTLLIVLINLCEYPYKHMYTQSSFLQAVSHYSWWSLKQKLNFFWLTNDIKTMTNTGMCCENINHSYCCKLYSDFMVCLHY